MDSWQIASLLTAGAAGGPAGGGCPIGLSLRRVCQHAVTVIATEICVTTRLKEASF